jgi:hypothetical protein
MQQPKIAVTELDEQIFNLVRQTNHKALGIWAADCAQRVLPYFEKASPEDTRPRVAIESLRRWTETGIFHMADVRKASLDAHAAARTVETDDVARSAARAAGQAMATAHVPTHAAAAALYATTVIRDLPGSTKKEVMEERTWQLKRLKELSENSTNPGLYRAK